MSVGIPGRVVERVEGLGEQLALVTVAGVPLQINRDLPDDTFEPGSWVIIHMGLAREAGSASAQAD